MGLTLTVGYDTLTVGDTGDIGPPPDEPLLWTADPLPVQLPGVTELPGLAWVLRAEVLEEWDADQVTANPDPWTAYLDAEALVGPLEVRPRRRGDRFQPQGMGGHSVKLSAFMINRRIPRVWRDRVPLVATSEEIAWVCGRRTGETFSVGAKTRRVVCLRFERVS
jgi:tRNA(Ile)-lysidine synthase